MKYEIDIEHVNIHKNVKRTARYLFLDVRKPLTVILTSTSSTLNKELFSDKYRMKKKINILYNILYYIKNIV